MPETPTTVFFVGVAAVVLFARYYLKRTTAGNTHGRSHSRPREVTDDMVGIVRVMLPHVPPESIRADLEQTRSIDTTIARLLDNRNERSDPALRRRRNESASKQSLLSKYDLHGNEDIPDVSTGWHDSREAREQQLADQRRAMILKARQELLAKKD